MSVFTPVDSASLDVWLGRHAVGREQALTPISEGVENTNYFLDTTADRYVLTLFERLDPSALPFYLGLMRHLASAGVPCPRPVEDSNGALYSVLCGKPAALVSRLTGRPVEAPTDAHCSVLGDWLGRMHRSLVDFPLRVANPRGPSWRRQTADAVRRYLDATERSLLFDALIRHLPDDLPRGIVHADLFRDNALWVSREGSAQEPPRLAGVIDFYFAGEDALLFDLAVVANDWCQGATASDFDVGRCRALLAGYHAVRPLTEAERLAWPVILVVAALRFWLSRLADLNLPRPGDLVQVKDPAEYRDILAARLRALKRVVLAGDDPVDSLQGVWPDGG